MKSKDPGTLDLWEFIYLLRDNIGKMLLSIVLCLGAAAFYLYTTQPVYTSSVLLEIVPDSSEPDPNSSSANLDASNILRTINLKIASQAVLLRVIKNNHLAEDPTFIPFKTENQDKGFVANAAEKIEEKLSTFSKKIKADGNLNATAPITQGATSATAPRTFSELELVHELAKRITVNLVRGSRLISVAVEDRDPARARQLAQSLIDEFFQESWAERTKNLDATRELLLAEVNRSSEALRTSEEKLEAYRKKYNAVSLEDQQNIVVDRLRDLNRQVSEAQNVRLAREPEAKAVQEIINSDPEKLLGMRSVAELPEIVELRRLLTQQEALVATLAKRYGPNYPTMIQAQSQLAELRSSLTANLKNAGTRLVQSFESAKSTEEALRRTLAEQEQTSMELGMIAIPYHTLEREVQANAAMYQKVLANLKLLDSKHRLLTLNDADGVDIRIIESPLVPTRPTKPRPRLILGLAVVVSLFMGGGLALVSRALDNTMSSVDATESLLGVPVLTTIPRSRHRRLSAKPAVIDRPASAEAESFRSLRTSLSLLPGKDEQKCILFTSAVPNEGKTYCSLNTAAAFAQQGFQTLLIDGDFRRPSLQELLVGWNENPGLTDCLQRPDLLESAIFPTPVTNLYCLGDRYRHPHGAEWLGRVGLGEVLKRAEQLFERIVIDTAPLMAVSDTLSIAKNVSTICLVVHAGHTPRRLVRRAVKLLDGVAKRSATGVILNKASQRAAAGHYYYYAAPTRT